jgi:prepilin peptidase CpaA
MMSLGALAALLGVGLIGSWLDVTQRRLPNWLCGLALVTGLAAALAMGGATAVGWHGLHALVVLLLGMTLFALGFFGAGDAKYYTALAAWFPIEDGLRLFIAISMAGLLLLIVSVAIRLLTGRKLQSNDKQEGLPYGVAIASGAFLLAIQNYFVLG